MSEIGMITEQGDLGLGFNPLNSDDKKVLQEQEANKDKKDGDGK